MGKEYFTMREVAKMLKVTERSIYRMIDKKEMPFFKFGGSWRIEKKDLEEYINKKKI